MVAQLPLLAKDVLGASELLVTAMLTVFSLGVGVGSVTAEKLSRGRVDLSLVPLAGMAMAIGLCDLGWSTMHASSLNTRIWFGLFAIGVAGGVFSVPLYAFLQQRSPKPERSQIIAANNLINALLIVLAAGFAVACRAAGLSIPGLLIATAALHAAVTLVIGYRLRIQRLLPGSRTEKWKTTGIGEF